MMSLLPICLRSTLQCSTTRSPLHSQSYSMIHRHYWKEVLRIKSFNPKAKQNQIVLEDVEKMSLRSNRAQADEGLLNRQIRYRNYVKPWMERKRAKEVKKYKSMEKGVSNLKRYVQFVNKFNKENNL